MLHIVTFLGVFFKILCLFINIFFYTSSTLLIFVDMECDTFFLKKKKEFLWGCMEIHYNDRLIICMQHIYLHLLVRVVFKAVYTSCFVIPVLVVCGISSFLLYAVYLASCCIKYV